MATGVLALLVSQCYAYRPVDLPGIQPNTAVRIHLTWAGMDELSDLVEEGLIRADGRPAVQGTLLTREPDQLLLYVPLSVQRDGYHAPRLGQNVSIPVPAVAGVERRELHKLGTGMAIMGTVVAAAAVVSYIVGDATPGRPRDPDEGPDWDESRVPLLRIPVR